MSVRPPIGTRYRISWGDGASSGVTIVPTGKSVPDGEVNLMRDGDGGIVTVSIDRLGAPEVVATVAAALRIAANWMAEDRERRMLLEAAGNVRANWDDATCPVCEEVTCDDDCPLAAVRHAVDRGAGL